MDPQKIFLVGLGGFAGAILRYLAILTANRMSDAPFLPYGTLAVNITGCLLIGFFAGLFENRHLISPELQSLLVVGFLGGFTTYSTFGYEIMLSLREGQTIAAFFNVVLHLLMGSGAVMTGLTLSKWLKPV